MTLILIYVLISNKIFVSLNLIQKQLKIPTIRTHCGQEFALIDMRIHFQMIILPFIPILALIVQTSVTLQEILEYRSAVADIETQVSERWVVGG